MPKYGMVIDLEKCMGCRACMEACKFENDTSARVFWMQVFRYEDGEYPDVNVGFLPRPCQHCDNPPCVKVCPTEARFKRDDDGVVLTNFDKCIGCRYCAVACPYGVNCFNWKDPKDNYYLDYNKDKDVKAATGGAVPPWKNPDLDRKYGSDEKLVAGSGHYKGTIEKCTFCVQRLAKGKDPACVANCPVDAFEFGDLDDPKSAVSQVLRRGRSFRLKEEFNTKPKVYYIGQPPPGEDTHEIESYPTKAMKSEVP